MTALDTPPLPDDDRQAPLGDTADSVDTPGDPAPAERSRRPLVLAAAAGFAIGICVTGLLWGLSGQRGGANVDAVAACDAFDRAGHLPDTTSGYDPAAFTRLSDDAAHRITAAYELAQAAAAFDGQYQPLAQSLAGVNGMVLSGRFDSRSGQDDIIRIQQLCARG
ncbi:hypothetical protein QRX50_07110 [Amycolatopsis carbonis]|uniref:Uncharacterized protein n=1 Tax=Amycolatopsis carbonis TaxID=715471 RepID=A0A9Y2MZ34_9PSEU|nr:hypothetical protein [Amycolatopsis sp. 2-15]WIX80532.1 hypothetical protein QRX50_07110 [Amycolatopsis sp. 2-15]